MEAVLTIFMFALPFLIAGIYLLPTIIAFARKNPNKIAIMALNILLGWTFIGWVISLVWAMVNNNTNTA